MTTLRLIGLGVTAVLLVGLSSSESEACWHFRCCRRAAPPPEVAAPKYYVLRKDAAFTCPKGYYPVKCEDNVFKLCRPEYAIGCVEMWLLNKPCIGDQILDQRRPVKDQPPERPKDDDAILLYGLTVDSTYHYWTLAVFPDKPQAYLPFQFVGKAAPKP